MTLSYIHLIRHGITEGNIRHLYYGASDIPLSEKGRALLRDLKTANVYPCYAHASYYTSGMIRTEETLKIIYGERPHRTIENLKEMNFGEFEMKCHDDLAGEKEYEAWIGDKSNTYVPAGGESRLDFRTRVQKGLATLIDYNSYEAKQSDAPAHSIAVCHGGPIAVIMNSCFPGQREHIFKWIPDPGRGFTLSVINGTVISYEGI